LDGTLTNSKEGIGNSLRYALDFLGVETKVENISPFIGPPMRYSFRNHFGMSEEMTEIAVKKYREYFAEKGIFENELYPGIIEMLKRVKAGGARTAMATSKVTEYAERIAVHFEIREYFDFICGSEWSGGRSAKKEIISDTLKLFCATPERAVMFGDRKYDIIGAREAGIDGIGVSWGFGSIEELKEAGATVIINSPDEIL
jgi:phosphoglycolate phosphatase